MRRAALLAASIAALSLTAGAAHADVTDVVVTTSTEGLLTIAGAGAGTVAAPLSTASATTVGGTASITGAVLTVEDATGTTTGWTVNAKYVALTATELTTIAGTTGLTAVNIGGTNISTVVATDAIQETSNATLGVPDSGLSFSAAGNLADAAGRTVLSTAGDGRGVTAFGSTYSMRLPSKTTLADTIYAGSILYTVAPKPV